jgi:hypothetical protein
MSPAEEQQIRQLGHDVRITIERSAFVLYDLISDIRQMGTWSPECTGGEWQRHQGPRPGSRFIGSNKLGDFAWQICCEVEVASRGHEFTFVSLGFPDAPELVPLVRWSYAFEPLTPGSTEVTETWEVLPAWWRDAVAHCETTQTDLDEFVASVVARFEPGIATTLLNLKRHAEAL